MPVTDKHIDDWLTLRDFYAERIESLDRLIENEEAKLKKAAELVQITKENK